MKKLLWKNITLNEFKKFLGIIIIMGLVKKTNL